MCEMPSRQYSYLWLVTNLPTDPTLVSVTLHVWSLTNTWSLIVSTNWDMHKNTRIMSVRNILDGIETILIPVSYSLAPL